MFTDGNNFKNISKLLSVIILSCCASHGSLAANTAPNKSSSVPGGTKEIASSDNDVVWKDDSSLRKNEVKIQNKNFSVSYPKCFEVIGEEGDENSSPEQTPTVTFRRQPACPTFDKRYFESNSLSISQNYLVDEFKSLGKFYTADKNLLKQKIKINENIDAVLHVGILNASIDGKYQETLRWQMLAICKGKPFRIIAQYIPGKPTQDRITAKDYSFPEDFKKIISSFQCK